MNLLGSSQHATQLSVHSLLETSEFCLPYCSSLDSTKGHTELVCVHLKEFPSRAIWAREDWNLYYQKLSFDNVT